MAVLHEMAYWLPWMAGLASCDLYFRKSRKKARHNQPLADTDLSPLGLPSYVYVLGRRNVDRSVAAMGCHTSVATAPKLRVCVCVSIRETECRQICVSHWLTQICRHWGSQVMCMCVFLLGRRNVDRSVSATGCHRSVVTRVPKLCVCVYVCLSGRRNVDRSVAAMGCHRSVAIGAPKLCVCVYSYQGDRV